MRHSAFCILLCLMAAGCGLFWDDPYVTVTPSALNWVEIHYYNATQEPIRRVNVRLNGAGFVEIKTGTSRLVSDSFARNIADVTWDDISDRRVYVDPQHIVDLFQDLVNHDLFDRDKVGKSTRHPAVGRFIAVRAAIDNKTYSESKNQYEADPELAELLYNIVLEFSRPAAQ